MNQKFKNWINIHIEVEALYLSKSQKGKRREWSGIFSSFVQKKKVSSTFSLNSFVKNLILYNCLIDIKKQKQKTDFS